jgi:hypothetical protein
VNSGNKNIQMASLACLVALRDKNVSQTIKAIIAGGLSTVQVNIIKQLANAYERTLSK